MSRDVLNCAPFFPVALCVNGVTSTPRAPLTAQDLTHLGGDLQDADARSKTQQVLGTAYSVRDPMDLTRSGWGVLFASSADPRIKAGLQPLLDLRQKQVQSAHLFQVFEGPARGVTPGLTASSWAFSRGVSLTAPVDPRKGVPYYLLLVGSPEEISFEFQALLKMQWAVGRLYFEDVEDYGRYARSVVAYESPGYRPLQSRNAAVWMTRNPDDDATLLLSSSLSEDFLDPDNRLGYECQFNFASYTADEATRPQLLNILRGEIDGGPPALIFTGSHGTEYPFTDPDTRRRLQGALLTQEWVRGAVIGAENQFSAEDVPPDAVLEGTMLFLFACYSGGCPRNDSLISQQDGSPRQVAAEAMIARLPQALLSRGALAVFAHIDIAYCYSFVTDEETPQPQVIRTPLELLMQGKRAGLAADSLTSLWSALSAQIGEAMPLAAGASATELAARANLTTARNDARNYLLLGDPAVRLRVDDLG